MTFHGTQSEVMSQMAMYHKQARQDMLNRKLAARLRKEEIGARQAETMVKFDASFVKGKYVGC